MGDLNFSAFKNNIIDHIKKATKYPGVISLFESLDGYIQYRDFDTQRKIFGHMTIDSIMIDNPAWENLASEACST